MKKARLRPDSSFEDIFLHWYRLTPLVDSEALAVEINHYEQFLSILLERYREQAADRDFEYLQLHCQLAARHTRYQKDDPIALIEAFLLAVQAGWVPPEWVLEGIHEGFAKWYESEALDTLDKSFGVAPAQGEHSPPFKRMSEHQRDGFLCWQMFILYTILPDQDRNLSAIADMVVKCCQLPPESIVRMIAAATLKDRYERTWRKIFESDEVMQEFTTELAQWPDEERSQFALAYGKSIDIARCPVPNVSTTSLSQGRPVGQIACLRCGKSFASEDLSNNRVCAPCYRKNIDEAD